MAFYTRVMETDEEVRFMATLSPVIYAPGLAVVVVSLAAYVMAVGVPTLQPLALVAIAPAGIGLILMVKALVQQFTTEIVLTNRRLIYKTGLVARDAQDLGLARIQGAEIVQSALGRLAGFGDIQVKEVGVDSVMLRRIARPLEFRRALGEAIHARVA